MNTNTTAVITRDYQGQPFLFREDGYFNMTKAAKHFGKRLDNFWATVFTREYMVAAAELLTDHPWNHSDDLEIQIARAKNVLTQSSRTKERVGGGTWGHPKLAVFFARWLDVKFAVWCDAVIDDLIRGRAELTVTKPEESSMLALPQDYLSALKALVDAEENRQRAVKMA
jgi:hypothetical protein